MKIKVKPEDFIVEEFLDTPIEKNGAFALYLLKKRGENTVDILHELSRSLRLPFSNFSYGGRKDRHALTFQHITIKNKRLARRLEGRNFSLEFLGFLHRPMGPDLIKGNGFTVAIRHLSREEQQTSSEQIPIIAKFGYANYFDDQRFGAFDERSGFLAEKILKKHFNGAVKIYLTRIASEDEKGERERKNSFFKNWDDWTNCSKKAKTPFEKFAFNHLIREPKGFVFLLRKIPREDLSPHYSSYQAYLWNEVLRRWIKLEIKNRLKDYKGLLGDYLFYETIEPQEYLRWVKLTIPTPASHIKIAEEGIKKLYQEVLDENELRLPMFNITKIRQAFFKGVQRHALIVPEDLSFEFVKDEIYEGRHKLTLKFFLTRGSYATMLIKRIFSTYAS